MDRGTREQASQPGHGGPRRDGAPLRITRWCVSVGRLLGLLVFILAAPGASRAAGIAAAHPGDVGLGSHPSVVHYEDFDHDWIGDVEAAWTLTMNPGGMQLVADGPAESADGVALHMYASSGLYQELPPGYDELFLRYYVKYQALGNDNPYGHTGLVLGAWTPLDGYLKGYSDFVPHGDEWFAAYFEPAEGHRLDFYNYWPGMVAWGELVSPPAINPQTGEPYAAGNRMIGSDDVRFLPDEWMCIEIRIRVNDPVDTANGELTLWIDGELVADFVPGSPLVSRYGTDLYIDPSGMPFEGLQWHTDPSLKLNYVWLNHYPDVQSSVHFDQLVVATEYVGPITPVPEPAGSLSLGTSLLVVAALQRGRARRGRRTPTRS